jgi:hypothetical protein
MPAITVPSDERIVSGTVTLSLTASHDMHVRSVRFHVDDEPLGDPDPAPPYQVVWDSTTVSAGTHVITAHVVDAGGHEWATEPLVVTIAHYGSVAARPCLSPSNGAPNSLPSAPATRQRWSRRCSGCD